MKKLLAYWIEMPGVFMAAMKVGGSIRKVRFALELLHEAFWQR
jgi:hypothetical protein